MEHRQQPLVEIVPLSKPKIAYKPAAYSSSPFDVTGYGCTAKTQLRANNSTPVRNFLGQFNFVHRNDSEHSGKQPKRRRASGFPCVARSVTTISYCSSYTF